MYFNAFHSQLVQRVFTDELGAGKAVSFNAGDRIWEVIRVLWREPNNVWWDDVATAQKEDRNQTVTASLQAAADQVDAASRGHVGLEQLHLGERDRQQRRARSSTTEPHVPNQALG